MKNILKKRHFNMQKIGTAVTEVGVKAEGDLTIYGLLVYNLKTK